MSREKKINGPLGAELQHFRRQRGLSQTDVAELLRAVSGSHTISRHEVSRWERGARVPSDYWLGWLAVVLNAPLGGLAAVQARALAEQEMVRLGRGRTVTATIAWRVSEAAGDWRDRNHQGVLAPDEVEELRPVIAALLPGQPPEDRQRAERLTALMAEREAAGGGADG